MFGGPVSLLVLLGVVLASAASVPHVTDRMKSIQGFIAQELDLTKPEIGGTPLFGSVIRSINTSCQRTENLKLMNATLSVYMEIFSSILHTDRHPLLHEVVGSRRAEMRSYVEEMQQKTETLKSRMSPRSHNKDDVLKTLNKINVDNVMDQKKALAEFVEVFQTASLIGSHIC